MTARDTIGDRLQRLVSKFPSPVADEFRRYHKERLPGASAEGDPKDSHTSQPCWLYLPPELARKYNSRAEQEVVPQGLVDDSSHWKSLILVADALLFEAGITYRRHLSQSDGFWRIYHDCLRRTVLGNARADHLARSPEYNTAEVLTLYTDIASVFKIGSAAVCIAAGKESDLPAVFDLSDSVAVYSQIMDDMEDLAQDLGRGFYNYVAASLWQSSSARADDAGDDALTRIARHLMYSNGMATVAAELRARIADIAACLKTLDLPLADELPDNLERQVGNLEGKYQRLRCETVLGGIRK
jgi:hypothetical protein